MLLMIGQDLRAAINRCVIVYVTLVDYYEALRAVACGIAPAAAIALPLPALALLLPELSKNRVINGGRALAVVPGTIPK